MPRVSVGLPVYNGANYLGESVESILSQTFRDFELIISDNASTDATPEICRQFARADSRVRYYRQERNLGCSVNSNFVFHKATGEYFKWVSHDDLHGPRFLERCVSVLDSDPNIVMCCPKGILIDELGNEIKMRTVDGRNVYTTSTGDVLGIRPYDRFRRLRSPKPDVRFRDMILYTSWCLEIYGLVRSELLRKTGLHGTYHGTDKRIMAELALMGPIAQLDEVMLFYRQHPVQAKRYNASAAWREVYAAGESTRQLAKIPRIRNMVGYSAAVKRADLSLTQRVKCYLAVARWFLQPNKWAPLLVEAAQNTTAAVKAQRLQKVANGTE